MARIEVLNNGTITVIHPDTINQIKIKITKDGMTYRYNHRNNTTIIPLQMGSGVYKVEIVQQKKGDIYSPIYAKTIKHISDGKSVFSNPNVIVEYSDDSTCVTKARILVNNAKTQLEKVKIISKHIMDKLTYDSAKASKARNGELGEYEPDVDIIYNTGMGMCYDYAALFAAMLRSIGIPCKLVFGHIGTGAYHAWNEVLIDNRWVRYDLTFEDANVKNYNDYTPKKYY